MRKRQFRVLYSDALRRIIDIEVLSIHSRGDASTLIGQFLSLLLFLSILFSVPAIYFGGKIALPGQAFLIATWTLQHFLIATTMLLVGLFAVLTWNSVFPDKRDLMILAPLPIRTSTLFTARIAAIGAALALLLIALHVLGGVVWPFAFNRYVPAQVLPEFASQAAIAPVTASGMKTVLDRDFAPLQHGIAFRHGGVSIGVATHGVRRVFAYGAAKPDSIYEIGSVTKLFTALALAQMTQQGLVRLNEPVRDLLPPGTVEKPNGKEITLLDLATHHSGLPRMPHGFYRKKEDQPLTDFDAADLYEYLSRHGVSKPADAKFLYSNLGFGLLGQVLADHVHLSYAQLIKTKITDPLGLNDTVVDLSPEQRRRSIQGYNGFSEGPDGFKRASYAYGDPVPPSRFDAIAGAGALHSTAADLLTFAEMNLHPNRVGIALSTTLSESHKLHADMADSEETAAVIPMGTKIALAWWRLPDGCYLHGGAMPGYTAAIMFRPGGDWAFAVLSNTGPGGLLSSDLIAEHIRQRLEGLPALSLAPVAIPASVYFLQPAVAMPNLFDVHSTGPPEWSPSYWFLGLFQMLNGSPALGHFAQRALLALTIVIGATAISYALCYFRSMRRIIEQPDLLPFARRSAGLPRFGGAFETAVVQFSIRTLLRSRQHRMILAFYLGIGFGATVFLLKSPIARKITSAAAIDPWREVSAPLLAASIVLMGFWVVGTRAMFSLPLELPSNWIFRMMPGPACLSAMRHSLWALSVAPALLLSSIVFLACWPWQAALEHLVLLALLGLTITELSLQGNQKIPFTCSWLPGKSNLHIAFWICIMLILEIVLRLADLEAGLLKNPWHWLAVAALLASVAAAAALRATRSAKNEWEILQFEEIPSWQLTRLELP